MLVVAVGAAHQLFIHPMMKWPGKFADGFLMTRVAKLRLSLSQQKLPFRKVMCRVAIQAAYVAALMGRAQKIAVFLAVLVALEAALHDFRRGNFLEAEDFRRVALALDVCPSRPMAAFAA